MQRDAFRMYYTVYKITNLSNGKFYIGMHQTNDLLDGYVSSGKLINAAIQKYGLENFKREILYVFDNPEEMKLKEKELVVVSEQSYNLCEGGHGGFDYINRSKMNNKDHDTELMKATRSANMNALWASDEFRHRHLERTIKGHKSGKMAAGYFGNRSITNANSAESIQKRVKTYERIGHQSGEKNSQYGTCWITNGVTNHKCDYHTEKKLLLRDLEKHQPERFP